MSFIKKMAGLGLVALLAASSASAATYPSGPVRLIVPFGAGGITDIIARHLGKQMSEELGQTVVIENRSGAGGTIGAQAFATAEPNGYTVFMGTVGTQIVNPLIMPKVNYDSDKFVPVGMISGSPYVLAARSGLNLGSLQELVDYAKQNPNKLNFGSAGIGSSPHLGMELLKYTADVDIVHIPFKSGGEAVNAAVGGQVDLVMDAIPVIMPQVRAGKLTAFAVATDEPSPAAPEVPTSKAAGNENLKISSWNALYVPEGTPDDVTQALSQALQRALANKAFASALQSQGSQVYTGGEQEYQAFISAEKAKWNEIIGKAGITLQ
ncbi:tripartite tricarboxylate transporter substrate binding protein [Pusillimonas sp. SM2304]|uniref:Bug family tripartite tricarboxylate transporter substrate binding protein n=1 Tax=Pusillimonas sp. SM2304 TaxID=3073241 RepID=UPI0028770689|nr:tripartite tricarboxylate transporter substrate binding protein [Pusillimonas sp. SM2304]MDS1139116.1 tripartite tricarboxylate transporter substrate binding protein [Pusillimonas sp. SM2304]